MKVITILASLFMMSSSFAETLVFEGYLRNSETFPMIEGRKCRLDLEKVKTRGGEKTAYIARPRIKDVFYKYTKKKAPLTQMRINDLAAATDNNTSSMDNVLVGIGSKYRGEISQRLYVYFNENKEISSWSYTDGTETAYGFTYSCVKE